MCRIFIGVFRQEKAGFKHGEPGLISRAGAVRAFAVNSICVQAKMHSYVEKVPAAEMERSEQARRPLRAIISASFLTALACVAIIVIASDEGNTDTRSVVLKPKFVDWKKEDAGSDDMNLHLQVADALAKADGPTPQVDSSEFST